MASLKLTFYEERVKIKHVFVEILKNLGLEGPFNGKSVKRPSFVHYLVQNMIYLLPYKLIEGIRQKTQMGGIMIKNIQHLKLSGTTVFRKITPVH